MEVSNDWNVENGIYFKQPAREVFLLVSWNPLVKEWRADVISERGTRCELFPSRDEAMEWSDIWGPVVQP